jgi:hypothetical protein
VGHPLGGYDGARPGRLVRGQSLPDSVFWKWEPPVPYVLRPVLGSSIFLYGSERDATDGANWGGSGVLVGINSTANHSRVHLYAVTNDHVAKPCPVIRLVNKRGDPHVLQGDWSDWHPHPDGDDIALRPLGAVPEDDYWYIPDGKLLSPTEMAAEEVGPGDDCLMVGRYINQELRQFDRPVVRFGNVAMLPENVYQDKRSFDQESFLVDMRSQAGFSGSPVFVYYEDLGWRNLPPLADVPEDDPKARITALEERVAGRHLHGIMGKTWLLGIDWGHLPVWDDVFDGNRKVGRMQVSTGMAAVVPAWKLRNLLDKKEVEMARDKTEKKLAERHGGAAVLDTTGTDEFAEFEDLTRKLVQVPKR